MSGLRLRLPATSANLGPGFDSLALALDLYLEIEAVAASDFFIAASGRNSGLCAEIADNLLIATYRAIAGADARPLAIIMRNGIPLGMGCGSSAATRLAGVALAAHFHGLGWDRPRILDEATRLEGHPDNTAACWLGGMTASCSVEGRVEAVSVPPPAQWKAVVVCPERPLATSTSRAVLPDQYSRADAVANVQRAAMLTAAFALGRGDLLQTATADRMHQPYRERACPLLPRLLPLAGSAGILSVTLSGAGPSVLLLVEGDVPGAERLARSHAGEPVETFACALVDAPATMQAF